jgi:hypothetical protein
VLNGVIVNVNCHTFHHSGGTRYFSKYHSRQVVTGNPVPRIQAAMPVQGKNERTFFGRQISGAVHGTKYPK